MSNDTVEHANHIITAIVFVSILLVVMILALVLVINGVGTAYTNVVSNPLTSATATNETGAYLNSSNSGGYTLAQSTLFGFTSPSIVNVYNSSGTLIASGNYTLVGNVLKNATSVNYNNLNVTYTYQYYTNSSAPYAGYSIQTNVLGMVTNFFALAPTLGTIFAVCILIAGIVILVIYVRRMKDTGTGKEERYYG